MEIYRERPHITARDGGSLGRRIAGVRGVRVDFTEVQLINAQVEGGGAGRVDRYDRCLS